MNHPSTGANASFKTIPFVPKNKTFEPETRAKSAFQFKSLRTGLIMNFQLIEFTDLRVMRSLRGIANQNPRELHIAQLSQGFAVGSYGQGFSAPASSPMIASAIASSDLNLS